MAANSWLNRGTTVRPVIATYETTAVTATGDTTLLTVAATSRVLLLYMSWSNGGDTMRKVSLKFGSGSVFMTEYLRQDGATAVHNYTVALVAGYWGEDLKVNVDSTCTIAVTVGYVLLGKVTVS